MESGDHTKAKTHKGRIFLKNQMAKIIEDPKEGLFINTDNSGEIMRMVLNDLFMMRKEYSRKLGKKNKFGSVFKDASQVEFFSDKNNSAFFTYTSDNKKRPMNLTLGSTFNNKVLDMFEYQVTNYVPIDYFSKDVKIHSSQKPVIIFQGDTFETDFQFERMRKFFLDFFLLHSVEDVSISDMRRIVIISVGEDREVKLRSYQVEGPINEHTLNEMNLTEVGPSLNLKMRQVHLASKELYDLACKQPKETIMRKNKNIETNALGERRGRVHMAKQNLKAVALKRYKTILGKKRFNKKEIEKDGKENSKSTTEPGDL